MLRLTVLLAVLTLAACDTVEAEPPVPTGTFTALLNGEPWSAPVTYRAVPGRAIFGLEAVQYDSVTYYTQKLSFSYPGAGFTEGEEPTLWRYDEGTGRTYGASFSELRGDARVNVWVPAEGAPSRLHVAEVDSAAGRLRATFEGVLVAANPPNDPYQELPDTLRFERGEFVIDLTGGGS